MRLSAMEALRLAHMQAQPHRNDVKEHSSNDARDVLTSITPVG